MCKNNIIELSHKIDDLDPEIERVAKLIYDGKLSPGDVDDEMIRKVAVELRNGVFQGYGKSLDEKNLPVDQFKMLSKLESNVYVFSGFKNYQMLKEATLLLKGDDGGIRPFNDFLKQVRNVNSTYNEVYLAAEYQMAVGSAQMAAAWDQIQENKDKVPYLEYNTAGDNRVRDEHVVLDKIIKRVDDAFWDSYYPPNDWGCRCDVSPVVDGEETEINPRDLPDLKPMFKNNVGKDGVIFPDTHPYFNVPEKYVNRIMDKVEKILSIDRDEYNNVYTGRNQGGNVEVHKQHKGLERSNNLKSSVVLADYGNKVKLLPVDNSRKGNPDATVNGVVFEFKTNLNGNKTTLDKSILKARKQANNILIRFEPSATITPVEIEDVLFGAFNRKDKGRMIKNLKEVWIIYESRLTKLSAKEIKSNKFRGKIKKQKD